MSGLQLLRLLVNERLAAAAEEIFGLVEKTIAEYQDEVVRSKREIIQLTQQIEQLTVLKPQKRLYRADTQPVSEELLPSQQQCDIKMEQIPSLEEKEIQATPQVKEEQVDLCTIPDWQACISSSVTVGLAQSEPTTDCQPSPSSSSLTVSVNVNDGRNWSDGSTSPGQNHVVAVSMEPEQPSRDEKTCRFCGELFDKYSHLVRHVDESHKGEKAFKCLQCNKEFGRRDNLLLHIKIHTKPYNCDFCGKTFARRSKHLVHMRQHTGEKPCF